MQTLAPLTATTAAPVETTLGTFLGMENGMGFFRFMVQGSWTHGLHTIEGVKVLDPHYRTKDERRWEVKCIKAFGLIKEGQTFVVARSANGLALFRECDLPAWTRHPLLSISNDGFVESNNQFFSVI
jgi:hypothetical protein